MSQNETIASEVVAASLGGAISASVLYPLEVLKTKMQAQGGDEDDEDNNGDKDGELIVQGQEDSPLHAKKQKQPRQQLSMLQFASQLYQDHGISVFFHGMETSAFQSAIEKALYFFAYTALKEIHHSITRRNLDGVSNLLLGCAAEWAHLPITLPLDCWTTLIQTTPDEKPMVLLLNLLEAGPSKMYKGLQAYWVLCLKPALQYTVFEQVKQVVVQGRTNKSLSAAEAFILGMVARAISTVVVFPYLRAKVMLQASKSPSSIDGNDNPNKTKQQRPQPQQGNIPAMLAKMYDSGGLASWFQGLGPELTRGVLSAAFMMMIKEKLAAIVKALLVNRRQEQRKKIAH